MLRVADHAARTDTGRARSANEDSYWVHSPLFVLADGMGGAQAGEVASQTAVERLLRPGRAARRARHLRGAARRRSSPRPTAASTPWRSPTTSSPGWARRSPSPTSARTTWRSRTSATAASTSCATASCEQLTDDHSLVGELVRRGQISAEEAEDHPQRSIITRALGIEGEVNVDHFSWPVRDGDVFLLCSDGLTGMVSDARRRRDPRAARRASRSPPSGSSPPPTRPAGATTSPWSCSGSRTSRRATGAVVDQHTIGRRRGADAPPRPRRPRRDRRAARRDARRLVGDRAPRAAAAAPSAPRGRAAQAPPLGRRRQGLRGRSPSCSRWSSAAAYIASQTVYFVGTDDDGFVTLYPGLPYELPGVDLFRTQFTSGVPAAEPVAARREQTVTDHKLRSQDDAVDLVRQIERGDLAGQLDVDERPQPRALRPDPGRAAGLGRLRRGLPLARRPARRPERQQRDLQRLADLRRDLPRALRRRAPRSCA